MIIGHQKQWQYLSKSAETNRLSHAYLFFGQSLLGKKTLAMEFIKLLFCQRAKEGKPCQACLHCKQIQRGIHPDLFLVKPQGKDIKISQIREISWKLSLRPHSAPFKTVIIDEAHYMNPEAQSCFLKTLEEPRGKAVLILISENPGFIFQTILSRVQKIRFSPVPKSEIENYLRNQGLASKEIQKIISFSFGKPGLVIDFLSNPQKLEERNQRLKELANLINADFGLRFKYVKDIISQNQNLKEILEIWLRYLRYILINRLVAFPDYNLPAQNLSQYPMDKIKKIIKVIEKIDFLIANTNINQRLALDQLMLEL